MPELPEVETTRLGISPHLIGQKIREIIIRRHDLRWPVSPNLTELEGAAFTSVRRRSKYLLLETDNREIILIHLGMSGSLRIIPPGEEWKKHDHIGITVGNNLQLRYHDPRRFGLVMRIAASEIETHPLWQTSDLSRWKPVSPQTICTRRCGQNRSPSRSRSWMRRLWSASEISTHPRAFSAPGFIPCCLQTSSPSPALKNSSPRSAKF